MKFLDVPELASLQRKLSSDTVDVRIEAYTLKNVKDDKALQKQIDTNSEDEFSTSPLGPINERSTKLLLSNLISTLQSSFPDFLWSDVRPDEFGRELSLPTVIESLQNQVLNVALREDPNIRSELIKSIDQIAGLADCEIFHFIPSIEHDIAVGRAWKLFYFFHKSAPRLSVFGHSFFVLCEFLGNQTVERSVYY